MDDRLIEPVFAFLRDQKKRKVEMYESLYGVSGFLETPDSSLVAAFGTGVLTPWQEPVATDCKLEPVPSK